MADGRTASHPISFSGFVTVTVILPIDGQPWNGMTSQVTVTYELVDHAEPAFALLRAWREVEDDAQVAIAVENPIGSEWLLRYSDPSLSLSLCHASTLRRPAKDSLAPQNKQLCPLLIWEARRTARNPSLH
jgi:hypothetical protein